MGRGGAAGVGWAGVVVVCAIFSGNMFCFVFWCKIGKMLACSHGIKNLMKKRSIISISLCPP